MNMTAKQLLCILGPTYGIPTTTPARAGITELKTKKGEGILAKTVIFPHMKLNSETQQKNCPFDLVSFGFAV